MAWLGLGFTQSYVLRCFLGRDAILGSLHGPVEPCEPRVLIDGPYANLVSRLVYLRVLYGSYVNLRASRAWFHLVLSTQMLPWSGRDPGFPTRSVGKPTVRQDPGPRLQLKRCKTGRNCFGGLFRRQANQTPYITRGDQGPNVVRVSHQYDLQ